LVWVKWGNIALQVVEKGIKIVGKACGPKPELSKKGVVVVKEYKQLIDFLEPPRTIFLSLPAGPTVDLVTNDLLPFLDNGDVILNGG